MQEILHGISNFWPFNAETTLRLATSLFSVLLLWLLHHIILKIIWRRTEDVRWRYRLRKGTLYTIVTLGIIVLGAIWLEAFKYIGTFLGLLAAGVAIALRDPLSNFAGWLFIVWRRPLEIGDRIEIGSNKGDVIDVRIFEFTLLEIGNWVDAEQSTGRIIHIPNGLVFTDPIANYSKGFQYIWNEIPILLTFESNWEKAKEILKNLADRYDEDLSASAEKRVREAARRFLIYYSKLTPTVYTSVRESGVLLTVRYLCEPRRRRQSEQDIWEDILHEFGRAPDIDFAYPTVRYYDNSAEGKKK